MRNLEELLACVYKSKGNRNESDIPMGDQYWSDLNEFRVERANQNYPDVDSAKSKLLAFHDEPKVNTVDDSKIFDENKVKESESDFTSDKVKSTEEQLEELKELGIV